MFRMFNAPAFAPSRCFSLRFVRRKVAFHGVFPSCSSFPRLCDVFVFGSVGRGYLVGQNPVSIPIPTKMKPKIGGAPTPKWDPIDFDPQPFRKPGLCPNQVDSAGGTCCFPLDMSASVNPGFPHKFYPFLL